MKRLLFFASLGLAMLATSSLQADIVSVNFTEDAARANQQIAASDSAGGGGLVNLASNWNNVDGTAGIGATGTATSLIDTNGAITGVSVSWTTTNVWGDGTANTDADANVPNARLLRGYIDDGGTGVTIDFSGITYANYDVFLIGSTDTSGGTYANATIGGSVYSTTGTKDQYGTNPDLDATRVWAATGLSGASLSISLAPRDGAIRGSIAGVQIVEVQAVPEPASASLICLGTVALIARRRRS